MCLFAIVYWQTQRTQNPTRFTPRGGSTPPPGTSTQDTDFAVTVAQTQTHRSIRSAAKDQSVHIVPMGRKKFLPCVVLLVLRQFTDPLLCPPLLFDWVISLICYGDTRELVFSLLTSIQSKDLIVLILIKTQVAVVFYHAIGELARSPNQPALFGAFFTHEQHA